jgi:hypothetical protein
MSFDASQWFLLISGLVFAIFGGLVFFSDRFFSMMQRTWWKQTSSLDKKMFPSGGYFFNRYGRGLGPFIFGLGLLWFLFQSLWK